MLTCNDCIHSEVCVRQKIYGEYSITECKGHFLGREDIIEPSGNPIIYVQGKWLVLNMESEKLVEAIKTSIDCLTKGV